MTGQVVICGLTQHTVTTRTTKHVRFVSMLGNMKGENVIPSEFKPLMDCILYCIVNIYGNVEYQFIHENCRII